MNIILDGKLYEGNKLEMIEDHLFLDGTDVGKVDNPKFLAHTIEGQVVLTQWSVIEGGLNV